MASFDEFLPVLLKFEGGFVNDPKDYGGATNKGITLATYRSYFGAHKTIEDLKRISENEAAEIYKSMYWNKIDAGRIKSQKVAAAIFDFAVNAGAFKASKLAQYVLVNFFRKPIVIDGIVGTKTLAALNSVDEDLFFNEYQSIRKKYYFYRAKELTLPDFDYPFLSTLTTPNPTQKRFLQGWINRVEHLNRMFPVLKKKV